MHLNIFIVLLLTFFTKGHSLQCYRCNSLSGYCVNQESMTCLSKDQKCSSSLVQIKVGDSATTMYTKGCADLNKCVNGSLNLGVSKVTSQCCNTDLCNSKDISDPSLKKPNGKQCYYCNADICSYKISCVGTEDNCITAKVNWQSVSSTVKGCVSKSMCDVVSQSTQEYADMSCCQGDLCNSAMSITQNLLLLLWPFISYIMFH